MIIGIDHGNKQIKTAHTVFGSGILESDTQPPFGNDVIRYKGKYYSLSEQRIPYLRNKTIDDRFFILTLYAIAYEIDTANAYTENDVICVQLAAGLPPAHFGSQYENFERYFSERRNGIEFEFNRRPYCVCIDDVMCFPQAYAAAVTVLSQIKEYTQSTIVDLGGFTLDYLRLKNGQPDLSVCDSLEHGVIHMYNTIKSKVNADFDLLLEESDIDAVIRGTHTEYPETVIKVIERQAQAFVNDLIGKLRERAVDLRNGKAVFVGGGSILLRKYIEASDKVSNAIFVDDVAANVKGYELLYRAYKGKRWGGIDGKKNAYKFTIQFNAADPHNSRVIDILNAQGRRKAQFIVNAVLHYVSCTKQPEAIIDGKTDYGVIEGIVKRVILSQTISDIKENESSQGNTKSKNKSENLAPVNLTDAIEDDALKEIVNSLDTFRRKNDENK